MNLQLKPVYFVIFVVLLCFNLFIKHIFEPKLLKIINAYLEDWDEYTLQLMIRSGIWCLIMLLWKLVMDYRQ